MRNSYDESRGGPRNSALGLVLDGGPQRGLDFAVLFGPPLDKILHEGAAAQAEELLTHTLTSLCGQERKGYGRLMPQGHRL